MLWDKSSFGDEVDTPAVVLAIEWERAIWEVGLEQTDECGDLAMPMFTLSFKMNLFLIHVYFIPF